MKIKIIKPFSKEVDFSSDKVLTVEDLKGEFYFKDLGTEVPKIDKKLALGMIKKGHAIEV